MPPDVPHELVATHILVHLPVSSLLRLRCVCKAWRDTIDDGSFIRTHLRVQNLSLVIAPFIRNTSNDDRGTLETNEVTIAGFYRWDDMTNMSQPRGTATLIHSTTDYYNRSFFPGRKRNAHDLAHCDGLVLVPTNAKVLVLNPATRRAVTLPRPCKLPLRVQGQQAFGFGHDIRSNTYKVARFFYGYDHKDGYRYTQGMEVFTLRTDTHWRETAVPPPCQIMGGRTATFFKGSLLWTALVSLLTKTPAGFVRFNLEDESFSVVTPPPHCGGPAGLDYASSILAELRGELCLCVHDKRGPRCTSLEMWMCADLGTNNEPPRWDRRYIIRYASFAGIRYFRPVAVVDEEAVFQTKSDHLVLCDFSDGEGIFKSDMVDMKKDTRYRDADGGGGILQVEYIHMIPYVASLLPVCV